MQVHMRYLQSALLMAFAISVSASTTIPKGTVIPVKMDTQISSAKNHVGDLFYAHYEGNGGGGIPEGSKFTGKVASVTKATKHTAGQISVRFIGIKPPYGSSKSISGQLTLLDKKSVRTDSKSGRLVGTVSANRNPAKFIAIGAGAGLIAGQLGWKKPLVGTLIGAVAGYAYSTTQHKAATGQDVKVKKGTTFGILLKKNLRRLSRNQKRNDCIRHVIYIQTPFREVAQNDITSRTLCKADSWGIFMLRPHSYHRYNPRLVS